jgi:hypothetical protein
VRGEEVRRDARRGGGFAGEARGQGAADEGCEGGVEGVRGGWEEPEGGVGHFSLFFFFSLSGWLVGFWFSGFCFLLFLFGSSSFSSSSSSLSSSFTSPRFFLSLIRLFCVWFPGCVDAVIDGWIAAVSDGWFGGVRGLWVGIGWSTV